MASPAIKKAGLAGGRPPPAAPGSSRPLSRPLSRPPQRPSSSGSSSGASSASSAGASVGPSGSSSIFSLPPKWLHSYDDFITKNLSQVSQIESALRSLTYIIPGRFRDAEIASEAIHSGVQLLSLYHDLLLLRTPLPSSIPAASASPLKPPPEAMHQPSQHSRYTRYWIQKSPFYRRVAIVLQIVRYTELLCEMAAKRRGERIRWRVVVLIEAVKAICRLLLLRVTRGRTLLSPALPVRQPLPDPEDEDDEEIAEYEEEEALKAAMEAEQEEEEEQAEALEAELKTVPAVPEDDGVVAAPSTPQKQKSLISPEPPLSPPPSPLPTKANTTAEAVQFPQPANAPPSPPSTLPQQYPSPRAVNDKNGWAMPRTGMSLPPLPQPGDISSYLLSRVLTADDIKPAAKLLNQLRGSARAAEILHILAPLVFAAAMARSKNRRSSWTPWLAGLAVELAARQLRDHNSLRTTTLEREEWTRRGWAMGWWSMRGVFYEHAMKGVVSGVRSRLPNFMGGILEDYEYLWENYYFSTSP